jgi:biopolymer transport protein TolQ
VKRFPNKGQNQRRYSKWTRLPRSPAPLAGTAPSIDMSVYGLFMQADWVVKGVMIALLLASFWSWAIIFEKMLRLRSLKKSAQAFEDTFWSGVSLEDLYDRVGAKPDDPMSSIFSAAMREWRRSVSKGLATSATARATLRQRIEQVMGVTIQREMDRRRAAKRQVVH